MSTPSESVSRTTALRAIRPLPETSSFWRAAREVSQLDSEMLRKVTAFVLEQYPDIDEDDQAQFIATLGPIKRSTIRDAAVFVSFSIHETFSRRASLEDLQQDLVILGFSMDRAQAVIGLIQQKRASLEERTSKAERELNSYPVAPPVWRISRVLADQTTVGGERVVVEVGVQYHSAEHGHSSRMLVLELTPEDVRSWTEELRRMSEELAKWQKPKT